MRSTAKYPKERIERDTYRYPGHEISTERYRDPGEKRQREYKPILDKERICKPDQIRFVKEETDVKYGHVAGGDRIDERHGGLSLDRVNRHRETSGRYDDRDVYGYENRQRELRDLERIKRFRQREERIRS